MDRDRVYFILAVDIIHLSFTFSSGEASQSSGKYFLLFRCVSWPSTCTAAGVGSVFWRSWARVIRGRLPVIGRPNADIIHHGPPPAYAHGPGHGREAVGGAAAWPQVHPGVVRGARAAAGRPVSERLSRSSRVSAGWRVPAEPTMLRLNSNFLGF